METVALLESMQCSFAFTGLLTEKGESKGEKNGFTWDNKFATVQSLGATFRLGLTDADFRRLQAGQLYHFKGTITPRKVGVAFDVTHAEPVNLKKSA